MPRPLDLLIRRVVVFLKTLNRLFQKHSGLKRDQGEKRRQQEGHKAAAEKFDNQKKWIKSNRKADGF